MAKIDVLSLLGADEDGLGYYGHFLSLRFAVKPGALARLREVIPILEESPEAWGGIIQRGGWRPQLVGCYALLLAHNTAFSEALESSFTAPSFVSPQVAVTFGLLHPDQARLFFEAHLRSPESINDPKLTGAAYRVLIELGSPLVDEFDIEGFKANPQKNIHISDWGSTCDIGLGVVQRHWQAWTKILAQGPPA